MIIYVDIDDTICDYEIGGKSTLPQGRIDYSKARPIQINIDKINSLYENGHYIVYSTARGTVYKENLEAIRELTTRQLNEWGAKYHKLEVGQKPYYDLLICDRSKRIEEIPYPITL